MEEPPADSPQSPERAPSGHPEESGNYRRPGSKLSEKHRVSDDQLMGFVFEEFTRRSGEDAASHDGSRQSTAPGSVDGAGWTNGGGPGSYSSWHNVSCSSSLSSGEEWSTSSKEGGFRGPQRGPVSLAEQLRGWDEAAGMRRPESRPGSREASGGSHIVGPPGRRRGGGSGAAGGGVGYNSNTGGGGGVDFSKTETDSELMKRHQRVNYVPIRVGSLERHETIPCPATGRRCSVAQDDRIRIYVYLPASGDKVAFWVDPQMPLGPKEETPEEKNCMTDLWGKDYEKNGPTMGRSASTPAGLHDLTKKMQKIHYPEQEQGPFAELLGLKPPPSQESQEPPSALGGTRPGETPWSPPQGGGAATPGLNAEDIIRGASPSVDCGESGLKKMIRSVQKVGAEKKLKDAVGVSLLERFRLAANVVRADVREKGLIQEADATHLKGLIHKTFGIPVAQQMILTEKRRMEMNECSLRQYGIGHGSTVTLIVKRKVKTKEEIEQGRHKFLATTAARNNKTTSVSFLVGRMEREKKGRKTREDVLVMPKWQHDELPKLIDRDNAKKGDNSRFCEKAPYYMDYGFMKDGGRYGVERIRDSFGDGVWSSNPSHRRKSLMIQRNKKLSQSLGSLPL